MAKVGFSSEKQVVLAKIRLRPCVKMQIYRLCRREEVLGPELVCDHIRPGAMEVTPAQRKKQR